MTVSKHFVACLLLSGGAFLHASVSAQEPEKKPVIEKIAGDDYKLGVIQFNSKSREIRLPGEVNQDSVILEFAVVNAQNGKLHESLLSTAARPFDLQVVMKLLKYVPSERDLYQRYGEDGKPAGPLKVDDKGWVTITVDYEEPVIGWEAMLEKKAAAEKTAAETGKEPVAEKFEMRKKSVDIGQMIVNAETKEPLGADAWVYTGSIVINGDFMAELEGAIAAVYRAEDTMLNAFAEGSDNDEVWFPRKGHVPPIGTPVTIKISPREKK